MLPKLSPKHRHSPSSPKLPCPTLPYLTLHSHPILSTAHPNTLPYCTFPSPTLSHPLRYPPYHTLAIPTLCSTPLPSHPSPLLPVPAPSLSSPTLTSHPLPNPIPYPTISLRVGLGVDRSDSLPFSRLPYLSYSTFPSSTLPPPLHYLLPSPTIAFHPLRSTLLP